MAGATRRRCIACIPVCHDLVQDGRAFADVAVFAERTAVFAATAMLLLVASIAGLRPSLRAWRVSPIEALRE